MLRKSTLAVLGTALTALLSLNIQAESISIDRIFASPALDGGAPRQLKVSPDGKRVTFLKGKETDYERYDLWEYHLESGKTQILFNSDDLHAGPETLSDEEKARRERQRIHGSGIMNYQWSADGSALLFPLAGDVYYFKLGEAKARHLVNTPAYETDVKFSPNGNYVSYVREQNLYVTDIRSGEETAITTQGKGLIKFAMAEFVAQEEMGRMTGYWWAPDESKIAFTKIDESPVEVIKRSEIYADSIKMIEQRYPSTGTDNVLIELAVQDLKTGKRQWIDLGDEKDIYLPRVQWSNDPRYLSYQWQSRDQQTLKLMRYDTKKKTSKTLLTESSNTWINLHWDLHFLPTKQREFIWASEKDGFKHIYLHDKNGKQIRQITKGEWVVNDIVAIDNKQQLIYFTGRKDTPIEQHLYRVGFDGGEVTKVSKRSGFHSISFSADASVYVDSYSNINQPSQVSLHKADGQQINWLYENAINSQHPLAEYQADWVKPSFGTFKNEEGVTLHYRLYTPKVIDKKLPAIVYVYGGPHAQVVTNKWAGNRGLMMQHWVDKGYVVFSVDNRGSNYRGTAFENPIYQDMGNVEVKDQVSGVKFLHTLPYIDKTRIGIHGHSYGGYMTIMAMFKAPDYFASGVSGAPVTDWLLYDTHYTERYMGHPATSAEEYTASSVFPYASQLKGDLLIYHGMADDNVLFKHSTKLYKVLQDQGKLFSVMDYPGKKHSLRGKATGIHLYKTITQHFDNTIGRKQ